MTAAEVQHSAHNEPIEPLSVFYGKEDTPQDWELCPFPLGKQENGRLMPQWQDLSQWMKVMLATMVCHQWDLLTFNIVLNPELEAVLVTSGKARQKLAERVRKELGPTIGKNREYFFVIEAHSKLTQGPTRLHIHGAIAAYEQGEQQLIEDALARAAGHNIKGSGQTHRAVHSLWFKLIQVAYANYLFKFAKKFDTRLDEKRLVISQAMTQAARMFWIDIARPDLRKPSA